MHEGNGIWGTTGVNKEKAILGTPRVHDGRGIWGMTGVHERWGAGVGYPTLTGNHCVRQIRFPPTSTLIGNPGIERRRSVAMYVARGVLCTQ